MPVLLEGPLAGEFRWRLIAAESRDSSTLARELRQQAAALDGTVQLWIRDVDDDSHAVAERLGFVGYRDLWQLRCGLPAERATLSTRGYADRDMAEVIAVNNRAFHWHPEQGSLTPESMRADMSEPWFDADGLRLHHVHGELVGFCWTKIHADHDPPLGEIYVIAVDPAHHGKGLGKPMTLAGLSWLADRGLSDGMLYVESDNDPANAVYRSIGFRHHHTDRCYRLSRAAEPCRRTILAP